MKTSELTGAALDWAVAKCWWHDEFDRQRVWVHNGYTYILNNSGVAPDMRRSCSQLWKPSTDWAQGGPVIEREEIAIDPDGADNSDNPLWAASVNGLSSYFTGPTPLIAAMRCYVASKLGYEVEIPPELISV